MADPADITIGARASCTDGFCGEVTRLVIDPGTQAVTHLVVEPKHRKAAGRLVSVDLVDTTAGEITLRCSTEEFDRLDAAEEIELAEGPGYQGGYGPPESVQGYGEVGGMGLGGSVSGLGIGSSLGHRTLIVVHEAIPVGETEVRRGERVHAVDGEIGRVHGFLIDPGDHRVTHVLLQEGHLWGRKEVSIPVSAVTGFDDGIRLNITKKQVENLPPAH
jgi:sporulation protein YlmC with PRC-barrel domain